MDYDKLDRAIDFLGEDAMKIHAKAVKANRAKGMGSKESVEASFRYLIGCAEAQGMK